MGLGAADGRFWQVQAVFGCEKHPGPGFAYTIGLAGAGLCELHMWDQPTHGDDPGADFVLSSSDLGNILNVFADEWVAGTLHVGDVRELSLDDGLTTAVVRFDEPVSADDVEAWGARPSMVVPLAWSLHRPPRGEAIEIMADARKAYARDIRATATTCDPSIVITGARLPDDEIDFDVSARYGPLSEVVAVHARAMASISTIDILIDNALAAEAVMNPRGLLGRMSTMARLSGRDEQVRQVEQLAHRVMDRLEQRRAWRDQVHEVARQCDIPVGRATANLRDVVVTSLRCTLVAMALDDVLPEEVALAAQGPWRASLSATGADPGQRWRCSAKAEDVLRRSFASLGSCALLELASLMYGPIGDLLDDDLLVMEGRALTRALAPPPVTDLVRDRYRATVSVPAVLRELSLFAQLIVAVVDGGLELGDERTAALRSLLTAGPRSPWWEIVWPRPTPMS